jgi:hypothetical protein
LSSGDEVENEGAVVAPEGDPESMLLLLLMRRRSRVGMGEATCPSGPGCKNRAASCCAARRDAWKESVPALAGRGEDEESIDDEESSFEGR